MKTPPATGLASPETLGPSPGPSAWEGLLEPVLNDRALQILLLLGLAVDLGLFGYLALRFEALPDPLPLHFDATGLPDRIDAKSGIFGLPLIGFVVFALNTLLAILVRRRERAATLLLVTGALLVQVLMWLAVINIAGGLV